MKLPLKERVFLSAAAVALAAVLISLAVLQYRWAGEVSDAANTRLQANLQSSMFGWHDDLYRELTGVFSTIQASPAAPLQDKAREYTQQFQSWSQTAPHANLIRGLYLFERAGTEHAELVQLNVSKSQFEPVAWPDEFANVKRLIDDRSPEFLTMMRGGGHVHSHRVPSGFDHHSGAAGMASNRRPFGPDGGFSWIDLSQMALARPQIYHETTGAHVTEPRISWIVVALDRKVLQEHVLPELAERYFSGSEAHDYEVAVVSDPGATVIFTSDPGFGGEDKSNLDRTAPVFGPPRGTPSQRRDMIPPFSPPPHNQGEHRRDRNDPGFGGGPVRLVALQSPAGDTDWRLLLRHRKGSLEAVVAGMRHRNLALSFGVLLVLTGGIAIILISAQRARMLARLQMDFVAAVSHELRTPLAVISSAAENIADGVVAGKQQLTQYGTEIKNQAKHLIQLVEQILLFSATRNKAHHYNLRPVRVTDVIEAALKDTASMIEDAHVTVEQEIAPNLPPIMGDLRALSHCLQNLITNAVKYGGEARWMRIRANVNDKHGHFEEVQISVEDKGLGIGSSEQNRIFEPFYRSRNVTGQIRGTGLGLSLARDIAEAMGGRLTVSSEPGKGSCFSLYLQFADVSVLQTSSQTAAAVNPNLSKT